MRLWSKMVYHMRMSHMSKFGLSMAFYRSQGNTQKRVFKSRSRPLKWWWWCCFFLFTYLYLALGLDSFHQLSSMRKQVPGVQSWAPTFLRYPKIRCSVVNPQSVYLTPNRILVQSGDFGLTVRAGAWPAGTASTASGKGFLLHRNSVPTQTSSFLKFARPIS